MSSNARNGKMFAVTISKGTFSKRIYKDDENGSGLIYYHGIFLVQLRNPI
jgi:hypothetical protein